MQARIAGQEEIERGEQAGDLVPIPNGGGNGEIDEVARALGPLAGR